MRNLNKDLENRNIDYEKLLEYVFDEVTSSLDINTSKQIINILKDFKQNHTILMITHKPQLMKIADEIIVIDSGKLVGKGKHKELIENNKYYQILHK